MTKLVILLSEADALLFGNVGVYRTMDQHKLLNSGKSFYFTSVIWSSGTTYIDFPKDRLVYYEKEKSS